MENIACIKPLFTFARRTGTSPFAFISDNVLVTDLPTDTTNIRLSTVYTTVTEAKNATDDGDGKNIASTYAKQNGTYPNLVAGTLNSFIVKGRQTTNVGWHKAMEIKAANVGAIGGTGYSAIVLVNGVRGSTGESVTPAGSSIVEVDCRVDGATKTFFPKFLKINILNGWLNTRNICAVLSTDNTTISVYINIE